MCCHFLREVPITATDCIQGPQKTMAVFTYKYSTILSYLLTLCILLLTLDILLERVRIMSMGNGSTKYWNKIKYNLRCENVGGGGGGGGVLLKLYFR